MKKYNILRLNKICKSIYNIFGENYDFQDECENPDAIILRSFNLHDYQVNDNLLAVGRAGAGVNNIPIDKMSQKGVVVFNTPGANANAVKELVLCGMLLASRDVIGGTMWVNSLETEDISKAAEKGKANFGGNEIFGKTIGIVGLGAIGVLVANMALCLGMRAIGYDPYITKENKDKLDERVILTDNMDDLYKKSDFLTIHVPLLPNTKNMIGKKEIEKMKDGAILLNMSRAGLVDIAALKEALITRKIGKYVVDFPTLDAMKTKNIIVIPHLGASTAEAEDNCASMAATELKDYLENGNIKNSVNFPQIQKPRDYDNRYCVLYKIDMDVAVEVEQFLKEQNCAYNVASSIKSGYGYMIIDADKTLPIEKINNDGILRIRKV